MRTLIIAFVICIASIASGQDKSNLKEFTDILHKHQLQFAMPDDFSEVPIMKNKDLDYRYAIRHKDKKLEIRFSLLSLVDRLEANKSAGLTSDPNQMYPVVIETTMMNLTGGQTFGITKFEPDAVKGEFNADDGGTVFFPLNSEYGKGYKNCVMVFLHKKDIADVYVLYLFDDPTVYQKNAESTFYSLTFKKKE